jgi:hypothetical protein
MERDLLGHPADYDARGHPRQVVAGIDLARAPATPM